MTITYVPIMLRITARDIEEGIPASFSDCAVALSMKRRVIPSKSGISVTADYMEFGLGPWGRLYSVLPDKTTRFIRQFDRDKSKCRPCRLPALVPQHLLRKGKS